MRFSATISTTTYNKVSLSFRKVFAHPCRRRYCSCCHCTFNIFYHTPINVHTTKMIQLLLSDVNKSLMSSLYDSDNLLTIFIALWLYLVRHNEVSPSHHTNYSQYNMPIISKNSFPSLMMGNCPILFCFFFCPFVKRRQNTIKEEKKIGSLWRWIECCVKCWDAYPFFFIVKSIKTL